MKAGKSRNKGFNIANGKYIALMDADDISSKERLQKQMNFLENNTDVGVVSSWYRSFKEKSFNKKKYRLKKTVTNKDKIKAFLLFENVICGPAAMIRTNILRKNKIEFNNTLSMAEDFDLWRQINQVSNIMNIKDIVFDYRIHNSNSSKKENIIHRDFNKVICMTFDTFKIDIKMLFNNNMKLKSISDFTILNNKIEQLIKFNKQSKKYNEHYLEEAAARLLHRFFVQHLKVFGFDLYIVYINMRLSKLVKLSLKQKIQLFGKILISKFYKEGS
ncbi:MAG: glycosyltransferase [Campylobacteraceae bacterium]|nr:glycosyltransferase [Candidatus Woesearchaeota archaeon]MBT3883009.1 glycosyltransferase [Campylobacteraceae bacterium]MBT4707544.1 glycosyltransferase [Campylobacteraceae bacterium]